MSASEDGETSQFEGTRQTPAVRLAWGASLLLAITIAALLAFAPTLSMPFFADDIDLLHRTADYREGVLSLRAYVSATHNEHRIPVMRLLVLASTTPGGLDSRTFHAAAIAVHVGCGVLVALMIAPAFGRAYALFGGALFAVSGVFSSMVVWAPTSAVFSLSLFFVLLARHAVAGTERPRLVMASIALLAASLSLNGSVVAVIPFCIGYWMKLGPTRLRRVAVAAGWIAGAALVFRWSSAAFVAAPSDTGVGELWYMARNGLFLVLSASIRWIRSWMAASAGAAPNVAELLTGTLLAGLVMRALPRQLRREVLILVVSAALLALAIGYGRREQPISVIYWTDRYYYAFAAPFAVASVAIARLAIGRASRCWLVAALTALVVAAGVIVTRHQLGPQVGAAHILAHTRAMMHARSLAALVRDEAARAPMRVPDGSVPLPGVHKGKMTLAAIVRGVYPRGIEGLELVRGGAPTDDARVNIILKTWALREGWTCSPVESVSGRLRATSDSDVDFRKGPFDAQIGPGFHGWNFGTRSRWLSRRGSLTLPWAGQRSLVVEANVPSAALRKAGILGPADRVNVRANGTTLGALDFSGDDFVSQSFPLPSALGDSIEISLESTFSWHARQVYPNNLDPRELSVNVIAIRLVD
ncbi:MAG: hypothetical protein HYU52_12630 [Acidobacteria bacterium]|nr:hypothetical protein [Acidobacteriota bacterium]